MDAIKKYAPYLFFILPALAFAAAGSAKLVGVEALHGSFGMMGLPGWFGYFIGACQLAGAIGLLLPQTRKFAAAGLAIIMLGAIYFHIAYAVPSALPATILLILLLLTMWWTWPRRAAASA